MGFPKSVGDKVLARTKSLWINDGLYTKIFPTITIDNQECFLVDKTTPSGFVECDNREDARKLAIEARDRARKRLEERMNEGEVIPNE